MCVCARRYLRARVCVRARVCAYVFACVRVRVCGDDWAYDEVDTRCAICADHRVQPRLSHQQRTHYSLTQAPSKRAQLHACAHPHKHVLTHMHVHMCTHTHEHARMHTDARKEALQISPRAISTPSTHPLIDTHPE